MHQTPTDSEIEILQILWQEGQLTVRAIHEQIAQRREVVYTTTLKQLQRMVDKGFVQQHKTGKSHEYSAILPEQQTKGSLVQRLVNTAFKGSTADLLLHALGDGQASDDELDALEKWLEEKRKGNSPSQ